MIKNGGVERFHPHPWSMKTLFKGLTGEPKR